MRRICPGSLVPAVAGEAVALVPSAEPAVCPADSPVDAVAGDAGKTEPLGLFLPEPIAAGSCPRIGCEAGYCRQDSDCTGGICYKFCPSLGCCL